MKLSKNFYKKEFECKDGSKMPDDVYYNIQKLANQLQVLRSVLNKPININSGYRSPFYNKLIGGVKNSQHTFGKAADISVVGLEPKEVYDAIEDLINKGNMLQGGLGLYKNFVHYDIRGKRARW